MGEIADYYADEYYREQAEMQGMWEDYRYRTQREINSLGDVELLKRVISYKRDEINHERFPAWDIAKRLLTTDPKAMTDRQRKGLQNRLLYHIVYD